MAGTVMLGRDPMSWVRLGIYSKPFALSSGRNLLLNSNLQAAYSVNGSNIILKMSGEKLLKDAYRMEKENDAVAKSLSFQKVVMDRRIFSQNYTIRSYDMGPHQTATMETLMNLLQETALNHLRSLGLLRDGLGSTPEMSGRNLIWVLSRIHIVVDHYPSWNDEVRVDNWFIPSGKNGQCTEWVICDPSTGKTLTRATSKFLTMNKATRKLSKMPEEVIREMERHYIECPPILNENSSTLRELDHKNLEYVRTGLTPRWNDLDANQHVNNVKYIGLMLESVPTSFMETHELSGVNLEYRKECAMGDRLQSLTSGCHEAIDHGFISSGGSESFHLLRFQSGAVVARGRTWWTKT